MENYVDTRGNNCEVTTHKMKILVETLGDDTPYGISETLVLETNNNNVWALDNETFVAFRLDFYQVRK